MISAAESTGRKRPIRAAESAAIVLAAMSAGAVLFLLDPAVSKWFPPCPFNELTGWHCPGCGSLRGLHRLLHGDLWGAMRFNSLMVVSIPFLAYGFTSIFIERWTGRRLWTPFIAGRWMKLIPVIIVVYWIIRNIPVHPFSWLAPG